MWQRTKVIWIQGSVYKMLMYLCCTEASELWARLACWTEAIHWPCRVKNVLFALQKRAFKVNIHEKWQTLHNVELPVHRHSVNLHGNLARRRQNNNVKYECAKTFSVDWDYSFLYRTKIFNHFHPGFTTDIIFSSIQLLHPGAPHMSMLIPWISEPSQNITKASHLEGLFSLKRNPGQLFVCTVSRMPPAQTWWRVTSKTETKGRAYRAWEPEHLDHTSMRLKTFYNS